MRHGPVRSGYLGIYSCGSGSASSDAGTVLHAICDVIGNDSLPVGLATIDGGRAGHDVSALFLRTAWPRQVTLLAEPEFDCVADTVDGAGYAPLAADVEWSEKRFRASPPRTVRAVERTRLSIQPWPMAIATS